MQHILRHSFEWSDWQTASARRLNVSMLLATILVGAILSVIRFPTVDFLAPVRQLLVDIVSPDEQRTDIVPAEQTGTGADAGVEVATAAALPPVEPAVEDKAQAESPAAEPLSSPAAVTGHSIDWEAEKAKAVQDAIDETEKTVSVNPNFDQRRKEAAIRFRPSEAPVKKEIWENVEKDQMGRTILRSGNCYRVLDDPGVVNRWAFDNFDQYITYCTYRKYIGKNLPWVREVIDGHAYLREREDRRTGVIDSLP